MRVLLADHEEWWWPLVMNGLTWLPITVALAVPIGIAVQRQRIRRRPEKKK
jgi:hypothetical protein